MSNYLNTFYSKEKRPYTDYPLKLATHLKNNYLETKHKILLDIGCGRGDQLKAFSEIGYNVSGCDFDIASKEFCLPHDVQILDIEKELISKKNNSVDVVFSKSVIEHLNNPEQLLNESLRILSPGGRAVIMCPSWMHMGWGPFYQDHTHVTPFTLPSLRDIMIKTGFTNVKVYHFRQLPFIWKYPYTENIFRLISKLPIPYSPMNEVSYNAELNKVVRFSKEVMLLAVGDKK